MSKISLTRKIEKRLKPAHKKTVGQFMHRMEPALLGEVTKIASGLGVSRNKFINACMEEVIKKWKDDTKKPGNGNQ